MPSTDERAKAFEMGLAARFGAAVKARRQALKLSASEVSKRMAELGYPLSRGTIAKIESNSRSGKVDVAELLTLSAALDIPPTLLLFHEFPAGALVEIRPGFQALVNDAVSWLWGRLGYPRKLTLEQRYTDVDREQIGVVHVQEEAKPPNDGVKLIIAHTAVETAARDRIPLVTELDRTRAEGGDADIAQRMLDLQHERIEALYRQEVEAKDVLWNRHSDVEQPVVSDDESDD
jgi:transcriptional regulator with XRE-family HTH domain